MCYFPSYSINKLFYQSLPWARTTIFIFPKKCVFTPDNQGRQAYKIFKQTKCRQQLLSVLVHIL